MLILDGYEELLKQLDRIDDQLTKRTTVRIVQAAAAIVAERAKELCPVGDDDGDENKHLRDTIAVEIRHYEEGRVLAVIGPQAPAGAHGHLVEYGHKLIVHGKPAGQVAGHPFLRPAFDETQNEQHAAMEAIVARDLRDLGAT